MLIWRDAFDNDMYHCGISVRQRGFANWFSIHADAIFDCWGERVYKAVEQLDFSNGPVEFDIHQFAVEDAIRTEREACALVAQNRKLCYDNDLMGQYIAESIRERGEA